MTTPLSILVVSASPDNRSSTTSLRLAVDELRTRDGVDVSVWFLRSWAPEVPWEGSRVVDSLRTWAGTNLMSAIGLGMPAGWLRGRKLRSWLSEVDPDVVILDDGIGARVAAPLQRRPLQVIRLNESLPSDAFAEPRASVDDADILIVPPEHEGPQGTALRLEMGELRDLSIGARMREPSRRGALLGSLGVPDGAPIIVGWGDDGWIDGPDLFIRGLWTLSARHGVEPIGVWLGLGDDPHTVERLRVEAQRCGLGDRFFLCPEAPRAARFCGDAVFLPVRAIIDDEDMMLAAAAGSRVVTFRVNAADDLPVVAVADLDLEAAAGALSTALQEEGPLPPLTADINAWVDRLLASIAERRPR